MSDPYLIVYSIEATASNIVVFLYCLVLTGIFFAELGYEHDNRSSEAHRHAAMLSMGRWSFMTYLLIWPYSVAKYLFRLTPVWRGKNEWGSIYLPPPVKK